MVHHDGVNITVLLGASTVCAKHREEFRQRFTGGCFDEQYIHLNDGKHFSECLNLSIGIMDDSNSHDDAHRLELACLVAKVGEG